MSDNEEQPCRSDRGRGGALAGLAAGGFGVWGKVAAGAIGAPVVVAGFLLKSRRRGNGPDLDVATAVPLLIAVSVGGAAIGLALAVKDVVQARVAADRPVATPLRWLFASGWLSVALWSPLLLVLVCGGIGGVLAAVG